MSDFTGRGFPALLFSPAFTLLLPYFATPSSDMAVRASFSKVDVRDLPNTKRKKTNMRDIIATATIVRQPCIRRN